MSISKLAGYNNLSIHVGYNYSAIVTYHNRYYDGNLPTIVPTDEKLKDEKMLLLHNMCDQYHEISKGLMATTLKLDSLVR